MPKFVNNNSHPIRVRPPGTTGPLRRIRPGEVVSADGEYADLLEASNGVEKASDADEKAWREKLADRGASSTEKTAAAESVEQVSEAVAALRAATSDPLQVVVGDDQAPHGPGTGTVTTKTAVRRQGDDADKQAFEQPGVEAVENIPDGSGQQVVKDSARRTRRRGTAKKRQGAPSAKPSGGSGNQRSGSGGGSSGQKSSRSRAWRTPRSTN